MTIHDFSARLGTGEERRRTVRLRRRNGATSKNDVGRNSQTLPPRRRKSSAPTNSKLLPGCDRRHVHDPFGNRIELIEPHAR